MKDKETLHKKVLEMIDCYATTDPLREMSLIQNEKDVSEASVKWLALAGHNNTLYICRSVLIGESKY